MNIIRDTPRVPGSGTTNFKPQVENEAEPVLHGEETADIGNTASPEADFKAMFEAELAKVQARMKVERQQQHEAIGYPTVTWLAVCPRWDMSTAAAVGFPTAGAALPETFKKLQDAGYGEIRDSHNWGSSQADPYFDIEKGPQFELLKSIVDEKGVDFVRGQAAQAGRSLLQAGEGAGEYLTRWAQLASRMDRPADAAAFLRQQIDSALARRDNQSTGDAARWLETAREHFGLYGGPAMADAVKAAGANLNADYERRKSESKDQIKANLQAAWTAGVSPKVTSWISLFPGRLTEDAALRCGLVTTPTEYEAALTTLQEKGVIQAREPHDEVHTPIYTDEAVLDLATATPAGKQALQADMVRWGHQLLAGGSLDDGFKKWATLYSKADQPQAAADFLTERIVADRSHWEGQPLGWAHAAEVVARVDGGPMAQDWDALIYDRTPSAR